MNDLEQGQINRCNKFITQYDVWQRHAKFWYNFFKVIAYSTVAVAPLVVVIYPTDTTVAKIIVAFISAVGGLCTVLNTHFNFHEKWVRYASAAMQFSNELNSFLVKEAPLYSDTNTRIQKFSDRIKKIEKWVVESWVRLEAEQEIKERNAVGKGA